MSFPTFPFIPSTSPIHVPSPILRNAERGKTVFPREDHTNFFFIQYLKVILLCICRRKEFGLKWQAPQQGWNSAYSAPMKWIEPTLHSLAIDWPCDPANGAQEWTIVIGRCHICLGSCFVVLQTSILKLRFKQKITTISRQQQYSIKAGSGLF